MVVFVSLTSDSFALRRVNDLDLVLAQDAVIELCDNHHLERLALGHEFSNFALFLSYKERKVIVHLLHVLLLVIGSGSQHVLKVLTTGSVTFSFAL